MENKVKPIPQGFHAVTPYLIIKGADKAIDFYKKAFRAVETAEPFKMPDGKIAHAELRIGDSQIMLAEESTDMGFHSPKSLGGSPVGLCVYVEDADAVVKQATGAGAILVKPVQNQFYGDRSGQIDDPFGHRWTVGTHVEDVSPEEMRKRAAELFA